MVEFLHEKFNQNTDPNYFFTDITPESLAQERKIANLKVFSTVNGSSKFNCIVFRPNQPMKASPRICLYSECQINFGSCSLFGEYHLNMRQLEQINLCPVKNAIGAEEGTLILFKPSNTFDGIIETHFIVY